MQSQSHPSLNIAGAQQLPCCGIMCAHLCLQLCLLSHQLVVQLLQLLHCLLSLGARAVGSCQLLGGGLHAGCGSCQLAARLFLVSLRRTSSNG